MSPSAFRTWILISTLALPIQIAGPALAADLDDLVAADMIGESIGRPLAGAIESAFELSRVGRDITADIESARRRFWQSYPDGAGHAEADAEFAQQLWNKDLYFVIVSLPEGMFGPRATVVNALTRIDGGIRAYARSKFETWIEATREKLGARKSSDMVAPSPQSLARALEATRAEREAYIAARNWAEFDAAGRVPAWVKTPQDYVRMLLVRYGPKSPEQARASVDGMVGVLGAAHVDAVAQRIWRAAGPRRVDRIDIGGEGGQGSPYGVFSRLLLQRPEDPSVLILSQILTEYQTDDFLRGQAILARSIVIYGKSAVLETAETIRSAPANFRNGLDYGLDRDWMQRTGANDGRRYFAFQDLLAARNPSGYARFILATTRNLDDPAQIQAAYAELVSTHGEEKVRAAARQAYEFWGVDGRFRNAPYASIPRRDTTGTHELALLMGALRGDSLLRAPASQDEKVENPLYQLWARFGPDARVTYLSRGELDFELRYRVAAVSEDKVVIEYSERRVRPPGERTRTDTYPIQRRLYPEELKTIGQSSGADGLVALRPVEGTQLGTQRFRFGETSIVCKEYLVKLAYSESRIWASPEIPGGVCRKTSPDGVYDNVLREYVVGGKAHVGQLPPPIAASAKTRDRRPR